MTSVKIKDGGEISVGDTFYYFSYKEVDVCPASLEYIEFKKWNGEGPEIWVLGIKTLRDEYSFEYPYYYKIIWKSQTECLKNTLFCYEKILDQKRIDHAGDILSLQQKIFFSNKEF